jgi:hypothetical protein
MKDRMKTHELKIWPEHFHEVAAGMKRFEVRKNDRDFGVGDVLRLREWSPGLAVADCPGCYTGREVFARVTYIFELRGEDRQVVLGIVLESERPGIGLQRITEERRRQMDLWTDHDAGHGKAELAKAAICYLDVASSQAVVGGAGKTYLPADEWPWDLKWWKPSDDPIRNLTKAGALIAAEIDRLSGEFTPPSAES